MSRHEFNQKIVQGGFVPAQRTPELFTPATADSLTFMSLSTPGQPGYGVYDAEALGMAGDTIRNAAAEFGSDNSLLETAC